MHSTEPFIPLNFGLQELEDLAVELEAAAAGDDHPHICGERHNLCGAAGEQELFQGRGRTAAPGATGAAETRQLLERLAHRMSYLTDFDWPERDVGPDNENLPAGYTYLAQFVVHDLIANIAPVPQLDRVANLLQRDFRSQRLVLDTLYGGGTATGTLPFAIRDKPHRQRTHFRLGRVYAREGRRSEFGTHESGIQVDKVPRDIPRTACPFLSDDPGVGFPDALIADPRNDDNLIVSQLTAVFHEFHNIVMDAIMPTQAPGQPDRLFDLALYRQFLIARKVVGLVYRRIIVHDLLDRLLEPETFRRYSEARDALHEVSIDPAALQDVLEDNRVPVEFSHAVFRFGHAMVRGEYAINDEIGPPDGEATIKDILLRTSSRGAKLMPLSCDWLVDWKHFFQSQAGFTPTSSRLIQPEVGGGTLFTDSHFPSPDSTGRGGLFYRDLIRGAEVGVRSVQSLIDKLPPEARVHSELLSDSDFRRDRIARWLTAYPYHKFDGDDVEVLASDPPLFFFTLFEARHDQGGKRLGLLGSTVVAEVMFAALRRTSHLIEEDPVANEAAINVFGQSIPQTMPELLSFMSANGGLSEVACPAS